MQTTYSEPKLLWCWNGTELRQKNLILAKNSIEWWFQETENYNTYDPFYVDVAREVVLERVGTNLVQEGKQLTERLERINVLLKQLQE